MSSSQLEVSFFAEGGNHTPELIISMPILQLVRRKRGGVRREEKEPLILEALYRYLKTFGNGRDPKGLELARLVDEFHDDRFVIKYIVNMIRMLRVQHYLKVRQPHLTPPFPEGSYDTMVYRLVIHFFSIADKPLAAALK